MDGQIDKQTSQPHPMTTDVDLEATDIMDWQVDGWAVGQGDEELDHEFPRNRQHWDQLTAQMDGYMDCCIAGWTGWPFPVTADVGVFWIQRLSAEGEAQQKQQNQGLHSVPTEREEERGKEGQRERKRERKGTLFQKLNTRYVSVHLHTHTTRY